MGRQLLNSSTPNASSWRSETFWSRCVSGYILSSIFTDGFSISEITWNELWEQWLVYSAFDISEAGFQRWPNVIDPKRFRAGTICILACDTRKHVKHPSYSNTIKILNAWFKTAKKSNSRLPVVPSASTSGFLNNFFAFVFSPVTILWTFLTSIFTTAAPRPAANATQSRSVQSTAADNQREYLAQKRQEQEEYFWIILLTTDWHNFFCPCSVFIWYSAYQSSLE